MTQPCSAVAVVAAMLHYNASLQQFVIGADVGCSAL